jgi:hypothetical protein
MWEIYGGTMNAVAIQTTVKRIKENVNPGDISGHSLRIKNVDYKNADEISKPIKYEDCFFRKRRHYNFEREVRISLDTYCPINPTKVTPIGYKLQTSLNKMIDKVVVHPDSPSWFHDVVCSIMKKYNLSQPVERGVCGDK